MVLILHLLSLFFPYSDNPNYFNTSKSECGSGGAKTPDSSGSSKGFFLFRRKNSTSKEQKKGMEKNEVNGVSSLNGSGASMSNKSHGAKHKGSFRSLLRSKSGSSHTMVS